MLLLLFLLQQVSCFLVAAPEPGMFRAAVNEHELVLPCDYTQRLCTRQEAVVAMEVNLRVADGSNPCLEAGHQDNWLLRELSCAALENGVYIALAAGMASKVPGCDHCERDGRRLRI